SQALHGCEFLVIPSRHEAMSIVVLEAGITKTPVIMTNQSGFNEIETEGLGIVAEVNSQDMARAMDEMLSKAKDERIEIGEKFYQFTKKNYTWNSRISKFIQLCESIT
ncbi:MAG: glycosyltransferase family 4 protein, partial [Oligoflexales bacterium]|nr:glycosyltransferase family 4 protein [Oligoflexales bacterium]